MHKLMGEENVGVNLVAEDESEIGEEEDEDEDEGWWVGTIGVMEMPDQEEETLDGMVASEPEKGGSLRQRDKRSQGCGGARVPIG
jgi:hypothetical protein